MKKAIDFLETVGRLKRVKRTGWVIRGVKSPESVAEHSYRTAILAMLVAKKLNLNENKLMKMALIHDLAEAVVGDVIVEGKRKSISLKEKHKKEKKAMRKIFSDLEDGKEYFNLWLEFERQKTKEAKILKQLDKLEMVLQALEYEMMMDPKVFDEFWKTSKRRIKDKYLVSLFEKLETLRRKS